jgi:hypothetical protein
VYLAEDAVFGVKNDLIGDFRMIEHAEEAVKFGVPAPFWLVDWDFILARGSAYVPPDPATSTVRAIGPDALAAPRSRLVL